MTLRADAPDRGLTPGLSLQTAVPVMLFLVVNNLAGLRWAVVTATVWSLKLVVDRRRNGIALGRFMPLVTAAVIIRGIIGVITGSETVYFGIGIAGKYAIALVLVGSVLISRPLATRAAPLVLALPESAQRHRAFHTTMRSVTLIGALYYTINASFDIWLFRRSSIDGFVVIRFVASWPLAAIAIISIIAVAYRQLAKIDGLEPLPTLFERRMEHFGLTTSTTAPDSPEDPK